MLLSFFFVFACFCFVFFLCSVCCFHYTQNMYTWCFTYLPLLFVLLFLLESWRELLRVLSEPFALLEYIRIFLVSFFSFLPIPIIWVHLLAAISASLSLSLFYVFSAKLYRCIQMILLVCVWVVRALCSRELLHPHRDSHIQPHMPSVYNAALADNRPCAWGRFSPHINRCPPSLLRLNPLAHAEPSPFAGHATTHLFSGLQLPDE